MNTPPPPRPGMPGRPPQAPAAGGTAIDPMKLLHKYKFVLVASVFLGLVVGVIAHVLFARFAPVYTSTVIFECSPVEEAIGDISVARVDETEMDLFMGTQVATLKSQLILSKVISDPRLLDLAPQWSSKYLHNGNIDIVDAFDDFEKMVRVGTIPKTFLIRLSVSTRDKDDAAGLVSMVKDAYRGNLDTVYNRDIGSRRKAIRDQIKATDSEISELTARKIRYVREQQIDSINAEQSTASAQLQLVNSELLNIQQTTEAMAVIRANDEAQLQRDTGIEYDSILREAVEQSLMMLSFKQDLKQLETALVSIQADGIQPEHRQYKQIVNQIAAHKRKIESTREELLREAFESRVQNTIITIQQLRGQEIELTKQKEELQEKLTELTRISQEIADIDRMIDAKIEQIGKQEQSLTDLIAASGLSSAQRVEVVEDATVPDLPTFPIIYIMIPAGVFVVVGLTAGVIVLFEMLDQRIKSAADIRAIPRTRSLGIIMDAQEDPDTPDCVHTVFADAPGSVLAEHFRQLRTGITSAMNRSEHHSLLVVGSMPQSGATTVVTNLAQSCVATNLDTLIIDANLRKPSVHTNLGLEDGPGLGDVLAGECTLESCVVKIDGGPSVLRVGSKKNRQVERLSGRAMKDLLNGVRDQYDIVLIDTAPAIVAGDSTILANCVDSTMLVVRAMTEKRGQVARLSRELGDCRGEFLGVVVNAVKSAAGGYMRENIRTAFNYRQIEQTAKPEKTKKKSKDAAA